MKKIFICMVCSLLILSGCKKETTIIEEYNPNIGVYGTWKVFHVEPQYIVDLRYMRFTEKKSHTVYFSNNFGFKFDNTTSFTAYSDQVIADLVGSGQSLVYNYSFSGDTLIFQAGSTVIKTIKANESEVADWVIPVNYTDEISGLYTGLYDGIGFDGTNILVADYYNQEIKKINLSTRLLAGVISLPGTYVNTVEFDGTDIWVSSNGSSNMRRFPASGGAALSNSPSLGPWIYGIAYDPAANHLWAYSGNSDTIYQVNKTNNTIISTKGINNVRDLAWSNGKLYMVSGSFIYRVNPIGMIVEKSYKLENGFNILGIAAVGNDFWLNLYNDKLVKVTLN